VAGKSAAREFDIDAAAATGLAHQALGRMGAQIEFASQDLTTVVARMGMSLRSWGERIRIQIVPMGARRVRVMAESRSLLALFDWGKNRGNLEAFWDAFQSGISASPVTGPR
jgi:hypothetical protein